MKWTQVKNGLPDKNIVGPKVLLYRIASEGQKLNAMTVHDTFMVKNCDPDETWWMPLPKPPLGAKLFEEGDKDMVRDIVREEIKKVISSDTIKQQEQSWKVVQR